MEFKGKIVMALGILCILHLPIYAQSINEDSYPEIGKPCPDFLLKNIQYYSKSQASLKDFKEKFLILDFFATGCASCFASLSHINQLQKDFKHQVQYILVGYDDKYIRSYFEKFRQKQNLQLSVCYDSLLFERFVPGGGVPYFVWIDDKGIVKAITSSDDVNKQNVEAFVNRNAFEYADNSYGAKLLKEASTFDPSKPFLIKNNGGQDTNFLFRSLLSNWKPTDIIQNPPLDIKDIFSDRNVAVTLSSKIGFQGLGIDLSTLYRLAYSGRSIWDTKDSIYGNFYYLPQFDFEDSSVFEPDYSTGKNLYSYSLIIPLSKATSKYFMEVMRRDLQNYFGYNVEVVTKKMPCWKLISTEQARNNLKTKDSNYVRKKGIVINTVGGFSLKNIPVKTIIGQLYSYHQLEPPFIDETGIKSNIDITLDALMTDLDDVRRGLQKNGLDLVKGEKEMKVIIIKR
jgi:thiol-disulfide isomerase/thioredoxin